jgi:hypothetical protein
MHAVQAKQQVNNIFMIAKQTACALIQRRTWENPNKRQKTRAETCKLTDHGGRLACLDALMGHTLTRVTRPQARDWADSRVLTPLACATARAAPHQNLANGRRLRQPLEAGALPTQVSAFSGAGAPLTDGTRWYETLAGEHGTTGVGSYGMPGERQCMQKPGLPTLRIFAALVRPLL